MSYDPTSDPIWVTLHRTLLKSDNIAAQLQLFQLYIYSMLQEPT